MAEYPDFVHGTRAIINANAIATADNGDTQQVIVYIGTAPVHLVEGGAKNVNKPMLIKDMSEARKYLGYSDDWANYTLCEAMQAHFNLNGVGPLVFINVFDPAKFFKTESTSESKTPSSGVITLSNADRIVVSTIVVGTKVLDTDYTVAVNTESNTVVITEKTSGSLGSDPLTVTYSVKQGSASLTPENGRVMIASAEDVYLDSIVVKSGATTKVKGTDYSVSYDYTKKVVDIVELSPGALGTTALTVTWDKMDPSAVTNADVIGTTDTYGNNTGIYAVKNVYNKTGCVPAFLAAPGFSSIPAVHDVLYANSRNISKHWNAWMFVDMPLYDSDTPITLATAPTWKTSNGYNKDNESVFFPMAKGTDGKIYHISVLNAANFQTLLNQNEGVPYMSGSNTDCQIIEDLYFGENVTGRVFDDEVINRCLNSNGINSAAYVSGRWAIWGMFAGSYSVPNATSINVNDTALMMLFYLTNDFQHRRNVDIDKPMPINTLKTIVAEEQSRVDNLLGIGALTYGKVRLDASEEARSDFYSGDFRIVFDTTNTPLAKSLTAIANWTPDGYQVYFAALDENAA